MNPIISIIIPVYNRENLIEETLLSIKIQSYTNWECLVIDDGSTDQTEKIVSKLCEIDKRFQFYKRPKSLRKGANSCRNFGIEISKGVYINWQDSDDIFHKDKLQLQLQEFEKSKLNFSVCQYLKFKGDFNKDKNQNALPIYSENPFEDFLTKKLSLLTPTILFKKSFLIENKFKFDENLKAGQEWDFFTRILWVSPKYLTTNKVLCFIREHNDSISSESNQSEAVLHYYKARLKIYKLYKTKLSGNAIIYLERYFLLSFKRLLRIGSISGAFHVWYTSLLKDKNIRFTSHILLLLSIVSYGIFNKGDVFLTKVNRWDL